MAIATRENTVLGDKIRSYTERNKINNPLMSFVTYYTDIDMDVTLTSFGIIIILIKITLFQEDNIFGTNASLTYGPQIQRHT